jgi:plastocyanin
VVDGKSTTTVQVAVAALQSKPYAVCVHKSAAEVTIYTAEGAIPMKPSAGAASASTPSVNLANFKFDPAVLTVEAGKKARFTVIGDSRSHTFTVEKLGVNVAVAPNATQTIEFDVPAGSSGEMALVCTIHQASRSMVGKLQVSPPGGASY